MRLSPHPQAWDRTKEIPVKDFVYRAALRIFLPHLARSTAQEARSSLFNEEGCEYVSVEDRGADTTIFSFAGAAMLYAGMPADRKSVV